MDWITTILNQGEVVLCERYTWSGVVYSSIEKGLIAPDLVVYIDTPPNRVVGQHAISTLFDDGGFQQQLLRTIFPSSYLDWDSCLEACHPRK